ncbi:MAG TPA: AmmeMemoRadiSam system protein B, partial [Vicinamibacteria bacterium]|nr:AmmeMemoRadiSam system protein B [Vicinamibacteria bacterium]
MAIRRPAVAGTWYPGDRASLVSEVEGYLAEVSPMDVPGRLVALISPHAGLRYSGPVAAHAYARLRGLRDLTVVLVGPSHRTHFEGVSVYARGAFATPLGEIPIDESLAQALLAADE